MPGNTEKEAAATLRWPEALWLSIDTETTGLERGGENDPVGDHRIVQLATAKFRRGEVLEDGINRQVVDPERDIPFDASQIHGIYNETVEGRPTLAEIGPAFLKHVERADVLVAYNWPFDEAFLRSELGGAWEAAIEGKPVIDPLVMIRTKRIGRFWTGNGRHRLGVAARRLHVDASKLTLHRADSDAVLAGHVLWRLWKLAKFPQQDAHAFSDWIVEARKQERADFEAFINSRR